jgi:hypothetical protein
MKGIENTAFFREINDLISSIHLLALEETTHKMSLPYGMKIRTKTGSEWHSTSTRSAMVFVDNEPIYKKLKPLKQEWELVGNKGNHGKWCIAEYILPIGAQIKFVAKAKGKKPIEVEFVVDNNSTDIDIDGYVCGNRFCGWIISI